MYFICFNHHKPKAVATATCSRLAQGAQGAVKTRARDRPGGEKSSRVSGLISYEMFIFINIHTYIHTYIYMVFMVDIYIYGLYGMYIYIYMVCI